MLASYDPSVARLKIHEGGYTNDPRDPGGPTNFGVTIIDARKYATEFGWIVARQVTIADMKAMPWWFAEKVFKVKYWDALRGDELPPGVDDSLFDYGVNSGIARAGKVLRRVLGLSDRDWHVTDDVLAALRKRDPVAVIHAIAAERLAFLKSLRTWDHFGAGWERRVNEVSAFSLKLADGLVPMQPQPIAEVQATGKGHVPSIPVLEHAPKAAVVTSALAAPFWHAIAAHPELAAEIAIATIVAAGAAAIAVTTMRQRKQQAATPGIVPVPAA